MEHLSNFEFLSPYNLYWASIARGAEKNYFEDPETTITKLRKLGELLAIAIAEKNSLVPDGLDQFELLREFNRAKYVDSTNFARLHTLRRLGNKAVHAQKSEQVPSFNELMDDALEALRASHGLCYWFCRKYWNQELREQPFQEPTAPRNGVIEPEWIESSNSSEIAKRSHERDLITRDRRLSDDPETRLAQLAELASRVSHRQIDIDQCACG